ncbi:MAG TPA: FHA domain-containing protein [Anaeromyxobacteraceae bacterium]|jgi:predicted component of type VI protein secretion system
MSPAGTRTLAASILRRAAAGEPLLGPALRVVEGPLPGRLFALGAEETLGRGGQATLQLPDALASRLHARVRRAPGGIEVQDLESKNGVAVNGRRLRRRPRRLRPGDRLAVGRTLLALEVLSADPPAGPAPGPAARPSSAPVAAALLLAAAALALVAG